MLEVLGPTQDIFGATPPDGVIVRLTDFFKSARTLASKCVRCGNITIITLITFHSLECSWWTCNRDSEPLSTYFEQLHQVVMAANVRWCSETTHLIISSKYCLEYIDFSFSRSVGSIKGLVFCFLERAYGSTGRGPVPPSHRTR